MNAKELYQAGKLTEAIAAQIEEVKKHPGDLARRGFLAELLCLNGDLERADTHLDAISHQDPQTAVTVSLWRQLIRAEQARQQFFNDGRVPEFLQQPSPLMQQYLQASIHLREGNGADAQRLLQEAEENRPKLSGNCNGQRFDDFRDLDDLTAGVFEILTSTGKYYWIPVDRVISVELRAPERPRDLLWRRAYMAVQDGPDGEVFFPTIYPGAKDDPDERIRLGRATDWHGGDNQPVRGIGLRTYLAGDHDVTVLQLSELTFDEPAREPSSAAD